jgi:hypothetical protein
MVPVLFTFYIQGVLKLKKEFMHQKVNEPCSWGRVDGLTHSTSVWSLGRRGNIALCIGEIHPGNVSKYVCTFY